MVFTTINSTMNNIINDQQQSEHRVAADTSSSGRNTLQNASNQPREDHETPQLLQGMRLQSVSLDKAVSPLLPKPTAPFARSERKRAHTNAVYYSECFLRGIEPLVADTAAAKAQETFDKWWIKSTANSKIEGASDVKKHSQKRGRQDGDNKSQRKYVRHTHSHSDHASVSSGPNVVSVSSSQMGSAQSSLPTSATPHLVPPQISTLSMGSKGHIEAVKIRLIDDLRTSGGNVDTSEAKLCLEILQTYYARGGLPKVHPGALVGNWLTISKPNYSEMKGKTALGDNLYTLGRISFDMFKPTNLVCSVQASFNNVQPIDPKNPGRPLHVPRKLMHEICKGSCRLHSYDIVVAITIEAGQDRKGNKVDPDEDDNYVVPRQIHGILTTNGYFIPDPKNRSRMSIWFSGGTLEVQDEIEDLEEWKCIFDMNAAPDRTSKERANVLAARVLLGAQVPEILEEDGTMRFSLKRPIGGHDSVFVDVIYMDDKLRIMCGHQGSLYVCIHVPNAA